MTDLESLPEDWDRALAVAAHPDDLEYGVSAAVSKWTQDGKDVRYLLVTAGEAGIRGVPPEVAASTRMEEQRGAAGAVGVETVEFLEHPDGTVVADLDLRRDLAKAIRRHRPEVLVSINHRDSWGPGGWNHADHRAVGVALLDAVRDAANPWVFRDLLHDAWDGVRFVAFGGSPAATHAVDVTEHIDFAIESLRCHDLYLEHLDGEMADPDRFLRRIAGETGSRIGVDYATAFEVIG